MRWILRLSLVALAAALVVGLYADRWRRRAGRESIPHSEGTSPAGATSAREDSRAHRVHLAFRAMELPFRYERGDSGAAWPVEPVGGGVGIADFDGDGWPDLFFAQGVPLGGGAAPAVSCDVLLRNLVAGEFADVSALAGLATKGYGIGVLIADYDEDGFPDVYVTRYGANTLWHNDGDGRLRDVTAEAGVGCELWSVGAAFADLDGDGDLDLFVANYVSFNPADAPFARNPVTGAAEYGTPAEFAGQPDVLYRNDGDGHFTDVTGESGITDKARGMGVLATDFDGDGWVDVLVANDAQANALWHNLGGGKFEEVGALWGIAFNAAGQTEANMGIAYGDTDDDGLPDILISHFVDEHDTLWRARPLKTGVQFRDETFFAGLGLDSRPLTGWGTTFGDFDHDGLLDLVVANGHIRRESHRQFAYENPPILWHNTGSGRFMNVTDTAGPYFAALHQARGLAAGDLDGDGDLDLVVVHHYAPSVVLWNESPPRGDRMTVKLRGTCSNRDAIGSRLIVSVGDRRFVRTLDGGGGYASTNDFDVHVGLGTASKVDRVEVRWPSGRVQSCTELATNRVVSLREDPLASPPSRSRR